MLKRIWLPYHCGSYIGGPLIKKGGQRTTHREIMFLDIIRQPVFTYFKHKTFRRLDSASVFKRNLLSLPQSIELIHICGHIYQHKTGSTNQAQHKPPASVKTNIKNITNLQARGLAPTSRHCFKNIIIKIRVLSEVIIKETNSLYGTNT
jgi:hypothetical protein